MSDIIEDLRFEAEMNRMPGWDRKIAAMLTQYAYQRQRDNMRGRENKTHTDALIMQVEAWIDAEQTLDKIKELAK